MILKKFNEFSYNEAVADTVPKPEVSTTQSVEVDKDLTNRINEMEKIRNEVVKIKAGADSLKGITKPEDVDAKTLALTKQYQNEKDSLISSALSYYNMVAEQQKLTLRQKAYETQIPELATKLQNDLTELVNRINDIKKDSAAA